MTWILGVPLVAAFCGTYVGGVDDDLTNHTSRATIAMDGANSWLTLAMDYQGDAEAFAMLLPVPDVLDVDDVATPSQELVDAVEAYGAPRAVEYTCEDALPYSYSCLGLGCSSYDIQSARYWDSGGAPEDTVEVLREFDVAGYSLVVLDAEQSAGLWTWLDDNGYHVPVGGEDILQEYIDQGLYFVAIKIDVTELGTTGWLPPLSFRFDGNKLSLPIRIGTISADGEQEVILNFFTPADRGQVAIANYPEVTQDTDCMVDWGSDFSGWYGERMRDTLGSGAAWIREHSWPAYKRVVTQGTGYHCDPCNPVVSVTGDFTPEQLAELGAGDNDVHFTRLRLRYTPETATEDLVFYMDNIEDQMSQSRFIQHKEELETLYPMCDTGWPENPGHCPAPVSQSAVPALLPLGILAAGTLLSRRRR